MRRPRARLFPLSSLTPASGHNSCPWNGNEEVGGGAASLSGIGVATAAVAAPQSPPSSSGLRDRKKDEGGAAAVGSAENEAGEGEGGEIDDGSLEWAELLLANRQAGSPDDYHMTCSTQKLARLSFNLYDVETSLAT